MRDASYDISEWDKEFRENWVGIAHDVGVAIADQDSSVEPKLQRLKDLSSTMSKSGNLPETGWPLYGALISSLQHIIVIVDDVASAREVCFVK